MSLGASREDSVIYVISAYRFNHLSRNVPIDARLLNLGDRATFYFVDKEGAPTDFPGQTFSEARHFPEMSDLGRRHLAEWTFLLSEFYKPFATYPFFMISTRFYEKNTGLKGDLSNHFDDMFDFLNQYGFGYLPSYNRFDNFISYKDYMKTGVLGMRQDGIEFINKLYGVDFLNECDLFSDFFCNYIGFRSREDLVQYVSFYLPFINSFVGENFELVRSYDDVVNKTGGFREEKPLTLLLEMISHLFFYKENRKFYGLHYNGHIEVDERRAQVRFLKPLAV